MPGPPDVSVILINYNTRDLTRQCVEALYAQTRGCRFEVILLDNGSSDGSDQVFGTLDLPGFCYHYHPENLGFSRACNRGACLATGRYLLFLNSDTVVQNDVVSLLYQRLTRDPGAGIAGPRFENPDGTLQVSCRNFPGIGFGMVRFFPFLRPLLAQRTAAYYQTDRDYTRDQAVETVSAGALMISRDLFAQIGGFDESSFMYGEDADICRQVRDRGLQVIFHPDAVLMHYGGQSSRLNSYRAIWSYYFAFYHLYRKYYWGRLSPVVKPVFFLRACVALAGNFFRSDRRITWNRNKK